MAPPAESLRSSPKRNGNGRMETWAGTERIETESRMVNHGKSGNGKPVSGNGKPVSGNGKPVSPPDGFSTEEPATGRGDPRAHQSMMDAVTSLLMGTVFPTLLVVCFPTMVIILTVTCDQYDGSFAQMLSAASSEGFLEFVKKVWLSAKIGDPFVLKLIGGFVLVQLLLMISVPGKKVYGPPTANGHRPQYTDNGFAIFIIDMVLFAALSFYLKAYTPYSPSVVYDNFHSINVNLNIIGYLFCLGLYFKGISFPSKGDYGSTSHFIFDYYWGLELYPRIFGVDIKVFTNCRFGCTLWAILPCCFAFKSYEMHGFVDSMFIYLALLLIYLTKFFWWEGGYMSTLDIILDRAGFYICWGCICFIAGMYTIAGYYLVTHPIQYGATMSTAMLALGLGSIVINYAADWERQKVRQTEGKCSVWGKPPGLIRAKYTTADGQEKTSLLLTTGFWGITRHFHYVPELVLAFTWSLTCGFTHLLPYTYFIFLVVLLVHRSYRDDAKCRLKYGKYWDQYCTKVPYKILPYLV